MQWGSGNSPKENQSISSQEGEQVPQRLEKKSLPQIFIGFFVVLNLFLSKVRIFIVTHCPHILSHLKHLQRS
jgi:hypothetical protein